MALTIVHRQPDEHPAGEGKTQMTPIRSLPKRKRKGGENGAGPSAGTGADVLAVDLPWDERKHPRDNKGRFRRVPGSLPELDLPEADPHGRRPLDPGEKTALNHYTGDLFKKMNGYAREGHYEEPPPEEDMDEYMLNLDQAIHKQDHPPIRKCYRGVDATPMPWVLEMRKGDTFHDRGFMSTSVRREQSEDYAKRQRDSKRQIVLFDIDVPDPPPPMVALDVEHVAETEGTDNPGEDEILWPRDQKFRITGVRKERVGKERVTVLSMTPIPGPGWAATEALAFDPNQRRGPDGRWIDEGGGALKGWDKLLEVEGAKLRNERALDPIRPKDALNRMTAEPAVYRTEAIGARVRKVIDQNPDVKAAEADLRAAKKRYRDATKAYYDKWHNDPDADRETESMAAWGAKREIGERQDAVMDARAKAAQELLDKVRPTGRNTGAHIKLKPDTSDDHTTMVSYKNSGKVAATLEEDSKNFPASWIRSVGSLLRLRTSPLLDHEGRTASLHAVDNGDGVQSAYNAGDLTIKATTDELSPRRRGWPIRLHELTHLMQDASAPLKDDGQGWESLDDAGIGGYDRAYYMVHAVQKDLSFLQQMFGEPLWKPKQEPGNQFYDTYSGRDYGSYEGGIPDLTPATELSSTGIEYVLGGRREYAGAKTHPMRLPWDGQYRNQMNYALGLLFKGGPKDSAAEFQIAGLPVPDWAREKPPEPSPYIEEFPVPNLPKEGG